ncbi:hypothetical protein ENBRE01_0124 [Enteropsectra breve]|nr:hypothetical protein ENBRE01_0124 [Enteropsectra breve]
MAHIYSWALMLRYLDSVMGLLNASHGEQRCFRPLDLSNPICNAPASKLEFFFFEGTSYTPGDTTYYPTPGVRYSPTTTTITGVALRQQVPTTTDSDVKGILKINTENAKAEDKQLTFSSSVKGASTESSSSGTESSSDDTSSSDGTDTSSSSSSSGRRSSSSEGTSSGSSSSGASSSDGTDTSSGSSSSGKGSSSSSGTESSSSGASSSGAETSGSSSSGASSSGSSSSGSSGSESGASSSGTSSSDDGSSSSGASTSGSSSSNDGSSSSNDGTSSSDDGTSSDKQTKFGLEDTPSPTTENKLKKMLSIVSEVSEPTSSADKPINQGGVSKDFDSSVSSSSASSSASSDGTSSSSSGTSSSSSGTSSSSEYTSDSSSSPSTLVGDIVKIDGQLVNNDKLQAQARVVDETSLNTEANKKIILPINENDVSNANINNEAININDNINSINNINTSARRRLTKITSTDSSNTSFDFSEDTNMPAGIDFIEYNKLNLTNKGIKMAASIPMPLADPPVIPVDMPVPTSNAIEGAVLLNGAFSVSESYCCSENKTMCYLNFTPRLSKPVVDPTLWHEINIVGRVNEEPLLPDVNIFSVFVSDPTIGVMMDITTEHAAIVFPPNTNFENLTVTVVFLGAAKSASYKLVPTPLPAMYDIKIMSDIFLYKTLYFSMEAPVAPATVVFENYNKFWKFISEEKIIHEYINSRIKRNSVAINQLEDIGKHILKKKFLRTMRTRTKCMHNKCCEENIWQRYMDSVGSYILMASSSIDISSEMITNYCQTETPDCQTVNAFFSYISRNKVPCCSTMSESLQDSFGFLGVCGIDSAFYIPSLYPSAGCLCDNFIRDYTGPCAAKEVCAVKEDTCETEVKVDIKAKIKVQMDVCDTDSDSGFEDDCDDEKRESFFGRNKLAIGVVSVSVVAIASAATYVLV